VAAGTASARADSGVSGMQSCSVCTLSSTTTQQHHHHQHQQQQQQQQQQPDRADAAVWNLSQVH